MSPSYLFGSPVLEAVARVIGDPATRRLANAFGGTKLHIPRKLGAHHPIVVALGAEAAAKLAARLGGEVIDVPRGEEIKARHRRVRAMARTGTLTRAAIAREVGLTERRIYQLLEDRGSDDQLDLFEPTNT